MKRSAGAIVFSAIALLPLLAASCSFLQPQPDRSRFYVLTAASEPDASLPPMDRDFTLGVGPMKLPDYLDRAQMATRVGANEVRFSTIDRWAEPLDGNFSRVVKENLGTLLGTERIIALPSFVPIPVLYEVVLEIMRFESDDRGSVELVARWAIRNPNATAKLLYSNQSRVVETASGKTTDDRVAAMSRAAGKLSEEIATEVRRVAAEHR